MYEFQLSREAQAIERSMMRELIAVTARPDIISFAGGLPAPELFPIEALGACTARVLTEDGRRALQYGPPYRPLQIEITRLMADRGVDVPPERVFITTGAQQALHVTARLLLDPADTAVVDEFVFTGIRQAFGGPDRELRTVPTDVDGGLDLDAMAEALRRKPRPRAVVTIPNHHNPLGTSLGTATRDRLVTLTDEAGVPIVEDDAYGGLVFEPPPRTPLLARAPERVIYIGSFSKIVAPAVRTGWLVAPEPLIGKLRVLKESVDLETSQLTQRVLAAFLAGGHLDTHLEQLRATYQQRYRAMADGLAEHFPPGVRWTEPDGGMFVWLELPAGVDTMALLPEAVERGVAYIPGRAFSTDGGAHTMRLNFSNAAPDDIATGLGVLGALLGEHLPDRAARGGG